MSCKIIDFLNLLGKFPLILTLDYKTELYNLQGHSSLTPIYLYIYEINFDVLRVRNSFPQLEVRCDGEWRSLKYAFRYDVILAHTCVYQENEMLFDYFQVCCRFIM